MFSGQTRILFWPFWTLYAYRNEEHHIINGVSQLFYRKRKITASICLNQGNSLSWNSTSPEKVCKTINPLKISCFITIYHCMKESNLVFFKYQHVSFSVCVNTKRCKYDRIFSYFLWILSYRIVLCIYIHCSQYYSECTIVKLPSWKFIGCWMPVDGCPIQAGQCIVSWEAGWP